MLPISHYCNNTSNNKSFVTFTQIHTHQSDTFADEIIKLPLQFIPI